MTHALRHVVSIHIPRPRPAAADLEPSVPPSVGPGFISRYALAYMSTSLVLVAPLLVTLALKVDSLVGKDRAPSRLALVTGVGALVALVSNPVFGRISDRTTSRWGMRRPWMLMGLTGGSVGILVVAMAPNVVVVLAGWCLAQMFFNALLAAQVAVLPDQVPQAQRGLVSGVLGVCLPVAAVIGTFLVQLFSGHQLAMFLAPCVLGALFILPFVATLNDRQLTSAAAPRPSRRHALRSRFVVPRTSPDFAWAFVSRFLFVSAYAILVTYQAYFLQDQLGSAKDDVPHEIFLGTLAQSVVVIAASLLGGRLSDRTGSRKAFVVSASVLYGAALFVVASASSVNGFLIGMALSGLGFGTYLAVDLALVVDVLPDRDSSAKDLGVLNIAGALPFFVAPALAPAVLAVGGGSYAVLYAVAGGFALLGALAILPIKGVR
jgi:MFS family permease